MATLRTLVLVAIAGLLAWNAASAARRGGFRTRLGVRVDRRRTPVRFWLGIAASLCAALVAVYLGMIRRVS